MAPQNKNPAAGGADRASKVFSAEFLGDSRPSPKSQEPSERPACAAAWRVALIRAGRPAHDLPHYVLRHARKRRRSSEAQGGRRCVCRCEAPRILTAARRDWTAFANDPAVIEHLEEMRVGEPIAIAGPFSIVIAGAEREPMIEFRITIETLVDTKRRKKPKGQIRKEERVVSDEADQAPRASEADDADSTPPHRQPPGTQSTLAGLDPRINAVAPFNDSIPF